MSPHDNIEFHGRGFRTGSVYSNIAIATVAGLSAMYLLISLSVPAIWATALFIGVIFLVIQMLGANIVYRVDEQGIHQKITPLLGQGKEKNIITPWNRIASYVRDSDKNRSMDTYFFLRISTRSPSRVIRITANKNREAPFRAFVDAFESHVEAYENGMFPAFTSSAQSKVQTQSQKPQHITRKKSFYHRPAGKFVTLLFVVCCGILIYYSMVHHIRFTHWFRLSYIIIPGTLYMLFRTFTPEQAV